MAEQELLELCRQIHAQVLQIRESLDRKVEQVEHDDLELRVRLAEGTLTKHRTIGSIVAGLGTMIAAALGALLLLFGYGESK